MHSTVYFFLRITFGVDDLLQKCSRIQDFPPFPSPMYDVTITSCMSSMFGFTQPCLAIFNKQSNKKFDAGLFEVLQMQFPSI